MLIIQYQKVKADASNFPRVPSGNKTDFDFCLPRIRPRGGGVAHIFFLYTTLTYNNGRIKMMNYISTPRANSSRELTNNERAANRK